MKTCGRCGVQFDATGMAPQATCLDCQEVTGEFYPNVWDAEQLAKYDIYPSQGLPPEIVAERIRQVTYYTVEKHMSARMIGKRLGVHYRTIERWRNKMTEEVPTREIYLRAMLWRRDPEPAKRGANNVIPKAERIRVYNLYRDGWSKRKIHRETGVSDKTLSRIIEEAESGKLTESPVFPIRTRLSRPNEWVHMRRVWAPHSRTL